LLTQLIKIAAGQYLEVFETLILIAIFKENSTQLWLLRPGTLQTTKNARAKMMTMLRRS
jgi:hypothetical protein